MKMKVTYISHSHDTDMVYTIMIKDDLNVCMITKTSAKTGLQDLLSDHYPVTLQYHLVWQTVHGKTH